MQEQLLDQLQEIRETLADSADAISAIDAISDAALALSNNGWSDLADTLATHFDQNAARAAGGRAWCELAMTLVTSAWLAVSMEAEEAVCP